MGMGQEIKKDILRRLSDYSLLLLGTCVSPNQRKIFLKEKISPGPAEIVQEYLTKELGKYDFKSFEVIAAARIQPYPYNRISSVKKDQWSIGNISVTSIGYNNLFGLSFFHRERKIFHQVKQWARKHSQSPRIIMVYSLHSPFLKAACYVKKHYPDTKIVAVVPDLPQYMSSYGGIKKILKSLDIQRINRYMQNIDKYVLYTKDMASFFDLPHDSWIVIEGLIDSTKIVPKVLHERQPKVCLYAGRICKEYGVDKLIEAFDKVNNAELHLYGRIVDEDYFKSMLSECKNSSYMGILSQEDVYKKMIEADLLINPRPSDIELAKYSCPSKTFEYIASGTPVLMTRLKGLPDEYYPHIYLIEDESVDGFTKKIQETVDLSTNDLHQKGLEAQQFLKKNKNATVQVEKIVKFIV